MTQYTVGGVKRKIEMNWQWPFDEYTFETLYHPEDVEKKYPVKLTIYKRDPSMEYTIEED